MQGDGVLVQGDPSQKPQHTAKSQCNIATNDLQNHGLLSGHHQTPLFRSLFQRILSFDAHDYEGPQRTRLHLCRQGGNESPTRGRSANLEPTKFLQRFLCPHNSRNFQPFYHRTVSNLFQGNNSLQISLFGLGGQRHH